MNAFLRVLKKHEIEKDVLTRAQLTTLQINMGDLCNQTCKHCHIGASPGGKNNMSKKVVGDILKFLFNNKIKTLDVTGGAPELNPHFDFLITSARPLVEEIIVRSNLTVFFEPGKGYLPTFFKENRVHLICSLPCYTEENVDRQRGKGVFKKSIQALKMLNTSGFAKDGELKLDMVHNPSGACLPGQQGKLEQEYKKVLKEDYGIKFDRLLTITNVAINKFKKYLEAKDEYDRYYELLQNNFNPATLGNLMCRSFLSVGFDGRLYDCDFNLALGFAMKDKFGEFLTIDTLHRVDLENCEIITGEHCLSCTAGSGSSCQGALTNGEQDSCEVIEDKKEMVKNYYGKVLQTNKDLKSNACCSTDSMPQEQCEILSVIDPEIVEKYYGCGSPIPCALDGAVVLDLGCGTGRDTYILSKLVGKKGKVIGIDMTDEQLAVAQKHIDVQMKKFGFSTPNVEFKKGYIEDLSAIGIEDNSVDVVVSNCVINLSPDKKSVFKEIFRILKEGGELYFSDVFSGSRVPEEFQSDPILLGECLAGALYMEDFRRMLKEIGCLDYRITSKRKITLADSDIKAKVGMIDFYSITVRAFKLTTLEDIGEDYGQVATYRGTIPGNPHQFMLDDHHIFKTGKPMLVCGNTASMIQETRYGKHFRVTGNRSTHYGPFPCGLSPDNARDVSCVPGGGCC